MSGFNYIYEITRKTNIGEKIPISEKIDKYMYKLLVNNQRKINTKYGSELYLNTHDLGISRQLFRDGVTQPALTGYFQRNITEGMKTVDIGSHIGYFSILFAKLSGKEGRVDAFEPIKENFDFLCENIELNGYEGHLQAHNQAI